MLFWGHTKSRQKCSFSFPFDFTLLFLLYFLDMLDLLSMLLRLNRKMITIFLLLEMRLSRASCSWEGGVTANPNSSSCLFSGSIVENFDISWACLSSIYPFNFFWEILLFIIIYRNCYSFFLSAYSITSIIF